MGLGGLGSYFVNAVGGCNDCHSVETYAPGGNPFEGEPEKINEDTYLAGGQDFGIAISPNLTPDETGRPAGLTYKKFFNAIRFGKDPDEPGELLKIMPWPVYSKLQDRDIRAVYEYLKAVPSIESQPTLTAEPEVTEPDVTEPETTAGEELPPTEDVEETTEPTGDVTEPPTETRTRRRRRSPPRPSSARFRQGCGKAASTSLRKRLVPKLPSRSSPVRTTTRRWLGITTSFWPQ